MKKLETVLVIGAGTMGAGIAQWFTQQGLRVELCDLNTEVLNTAETKINASWEKLVQKDKFSVSQLELFKKNISYKELNGFTPKCDLVVEAIIENLEIKKQLFADLDKKLPRETLFASNTSSLTVGSLTKDLPFERQKNFLGLHFFNPATIMKLVEVVEGPQTLKENIDFSISWFEGKGKMPAHCQDRPGFIVNRVARNFYGEPLRIAKVLDRSLIKEIDTVLKEVGGFRMGPFELMDLIGIDVNYDVTVSVWKAFYNEPRFQPHQLQKSLVDRGCLGKKTGEGFYKYE